MLHAISAHPTATQVQVRGCFALWTMAVDEDNQLKITSLGGIEALLHAMCAHPKAALVQQSGLFVLQIRAVYENSWVKSASLGGIEALMHAMSAHPDATQMQVSGCLARESLATCVDNLAKIAPLGGIEAAPQDAAGSSGIALWRCSWLSLVAMQPAQLCGVAAGSWPSFVAIQLAPGPALGRGAGAALGRRSWLCRCS